MKTDVEQTANWEAGSKFGQKLGRGGSCCRDNFYISRADAI